MEIVFGLLSFLIEHSCKLCLGTPVVSLLLLELEGFFINCRLAYLNGLVFAEFISSGWIGWNGNGWLDLELILRELINLFSSLNSFNSFGITLFNLFREVLIRTDYRVRAILALTSLTNQLSHSSC